MNRRKNKKITYLLLLLLGISIGFAALATTLKINGTANIGKNTWNVYWDNVDNEDGVEAVTPTIGPDENSVPKSVVTWEVVLNTPGDYYEFTVDAVNAGTIDAEITEIVSKYGDSVIPNTIDENNPSPVPSYIKYSVVYADNNEKPAVGEKLLKASDPTDENTFTRKTYKIRVEYDKDAVTNSIINEMADEGESHTFSFEVKYGQATPSDEDPIAARIAEIEADPESHRNPEQDTTNRDIGLDENGNVIDLDWWTDEYGNRDYSLRVIRDPLAPGEGGTLVDNEIVLGVYYDADSPTSWRSGVETIATASENVVNGECIAPIPAYIMFADSDEFYPVTEISYAFGSYGESDKNEISKMPRLPKTITRIGEAAFWYLDSFEDVEIPKQVEYIGANAFQDSFNSSGENNTLTFENGSQLKRIEIFGFYRNNIKGNLVLPDSVTYIGLDAFTENAFTSVSFPTSAQYFVDYYTPEEHYGPYGSFDNDTTIIRR